MTSTGTAKCRRCHRSLTSLSSCLAGIGPRCAAIEAALKDLKPEQQAKALEAVADKAVEPTTHKGVYRVISSDGTTAYLASVKGNCNCAHGLRTMTAKTCWHPGAARLKAKSRLSLTKAA